MSYFELTFIYGVRKGVEVWVLSFIEHPVFPATFVENILLSCFISLVPLLKLSLPYVGESISELYSVC